MSAFTGTKDTLLDLLCYEKEYFWIEHAALPDEEIHHLWASRAAQLNSVLSSAPPVPRCNLENSRSRENQFKFSSSNAVSSLSKRIPDQPASQSLDRGKSISQRSTPMSRKRSNGSGNGQPPFSSSGRTAPPLTINSWQSNLDEPLSNFTIGNAPKMRRTASGRQNLFQVSELDVYEDPAVYCSKLNDSNNSQSQFPTVPRLQRPSRNSSRLSVSPNQASPIGNLSAFSQSPTTPITGELTNGSTMSRQSSLVSGSLCGGFDMMAIQSQRSNMSDWSMVEEQSSNKPQKSLDISNDTFNMLSSPRSHLFGHAGGIMDNSDCSTLAMPSIIPSSIQLASALDDNTEMKRSASAESNASSQSRVSRRRQEQLVQSSRPIAPKMFDEELAMTRQPSSEHRMIRVKSADGSIQEKISISKTQQNRPIHEKVKCTKCNEKPDGFRGPHELQRHTDRAHRMLRKAWVCVDMSQNKDFLASCKACRTNKKYGAYYNAAAHLRRTHFNKRERGRKGKGKNEENRSGKGGGDHPSMDVLKTWMQEVDEFVPENLINDFDGEHVDMQTMDQLSNVSLDTNFPDMSFDNLMFDFNSSPSNNPQTCGGFDVSNFFSDLQ